jgi:hypothetical protein
MKTKAISDFRVTLERNHTMKLQLFRSALLLVLVGIPALASAEETVPQDGLWFKGGIGLSSLRMGSTGTAGDIIHSGGGAALQLSLGGVVTPGLVVHASLTSAASSGASIDIPAGITGPATADLAVGALGIGATYYWNEASLTARVQTATGEGLGISNKWSGALLGLDWNYDFSTSASRRYGVGIGYESSTMTTDVGSETGYGALSLLFNGTFY